MSFTLLQAYPALPSRATRICKFLVFPTCGCSDSVRVVPGSLLDPGSPLDQKIYSLDSLTGLYRG